MPTKNDDDKTLVRGMGLDRQRNLVCLNGTKIPLTPTEFQLLWTLVADSGRVFSRRELLNHSRGADSPTMERAIDVHIQSLRKKLDYRLRRIVTVRGSGYCFQDER